ncbi:MAG: helix-turn-helix domain-containing protein [Ktedonobacterales bacterium]
MAAATLASLSTPTAPVTGPTTPLPLRTRAGQPASEPDTAENPLTPTGATPDAAAPQSPRALKDRAFDLYAHGFRSPAIAAQLGVSERTIRNWLQITIQQLAQDDVTANPEIARQQRALAIESQRAVAATAWTSYQQLNDAYTRLMSRALAPTNSQPERLLAGINRLASTAARHLAVVISANREIARIQGQAVTQATREQHAATQQANAEAADLLRILTMPIPTPSARPSALDPLPPMHTPIPGATLPDLATTAAHSSMHDIPHTDIPSTNDLPAPDFPPLPDDVIAAIMSRVRDIEAKKAAGQDGRDGPGAPIPATQMKIAAKTATPTIPTATTPAAPRLPGSAQEQREESEAPAKTKLAAKTASPTHAKSKSSHRPTIAIPSRTARKLQKPRPA